MIKEFDRVVLKQDLPEKGLMHGDIGTVVMMHDSGKGYEVEFFTLDGKTLTVETLFADQVRKVETDEIAHVRKIGQSS